MDERIKDDDNGTDDAWTDRGRCVVSGLVRIKIDSLNSAANKTMIIMAIARCHQDYTHNCPLEAIGDILV